MKKKKLKKILAVMLAAMTVSAIPGLVGAMSDASKAKIQNLNQKIENNAIMSEVDVNQSLKDLEKIANEDDEGKVEVSKILGEMIDKGVFEERTDKAPQSICSSETLSKIIEIFDICSKYDGAKENTALAIEKMAMKSLFGEYVYDLNSGYYYYIERELCSSKQLDDI